MWPQASSGQASTTSLASVSQQQQDELNAAEWYWGTITREQVKLLLAGRPDGSFLVRDALSLDSKYTLTLIKDGTDKLIRIFYSDGRYGFDDFNQFNSVVELINYYKENSLKWYNKALDITLAYPIARYMDDDENSATLGGLRPNVERFLAVHRKLYVQQQNLDEKVRIFKAVEMELSEKKRHQDIYQKALKMFQNQIKLLENCILSAPVSGSASNAASSASGGLTRGQELEQLQQNAAMLKERLEALFSEMEKLDLYVEEKTEEFKVLERQINSARPEIQKLAANKEELSEYLRYKGIKEDDFKDIIKMGYDAWQRRYDSVTNQPHSDESLWLLGDCTRQEAVELLKDAPTGTFLIRPRNVHYALSIMCNNCTNHCIIYETEDGFGFAAPYNIYRTLKDLVEHYASNSLEEHNDTLTTTLKIPVRYWQYNKDKVLQQLTEQQRINERDEFIVLSAGQSTGGGGGTAAGIGGGGGGGGGNTVGVSMMSMIPPTAADALQQQAAAATNMSQSPITQGFYYGGTGGGNGSIGGGGTGNA